MESPGTVRRESGVGSQIMAAMSYLGILALVPLVINGRDPYVGFHARQGLILWIWEVLAVFSLAIPVVGRIFFQISSMICFILSVAGLLSVLLGKAWKLPIVGNWAEKL
jgi:fumarate reductase subunit D